MAPSARSPGPRVRRQLVRSWKTSLNTTMKPTSDSSSRPAARTIHVAHPAISRPGARASGGITKNATAIAAIATHLTL